MRYEGKLVSSKYYEGNRKRLNTLSAHYTSSRSSNSRLSLLNSLNIAFTRLP